MSLYEYHSPSLRQVYTTMNLILGGEGIFLNMHPQGIPLTHTSVHVMPYKYPKCTQGAKELHTDLASIKTCST